MKFLVTGATGFIGKEVVKLIEQNGFEVFTTSRYKSKKKNQFQIPKKNIKEFFKKIFLKIEPQYVIHLAGSIKDQSFVQSIKSNCYITYEILSAIEECKLEKTVKSLIVGSASEYGFVSRRQLPVTEKSVMNPNSVYGLSKSIQSHVVSNFLKKNKNIIYIRPFNVIGKGMSVNLSLGNFNKKIDLIKKGKIKKQIDIRNPNAARDFIDVTDTANIILKLIKNKKSYGKYINICSGKSVKIKKILEYMILLSNENIEIISENASQKNQDMNIYFGDNKKLIQLIGDFKFIPWKKTVKKMMF